MEKILRVYEQDILDQAYKKHPIWKYDKGKALFAIFAAFDSFALPHLMFPEKSIGQLQLFKSTEEGFVHAIRFFSSIYNTVNPSSSSNRELFEVAGNFILFCIEYAIVAHFHMLFSKGLCKVEIDEKARLVTFIPVNTSWDGGGGFGQGAEVEVQLQKRISGSIHDSSASAVLEGVKFNLINGRIVFTDYSFLGQKALTAKATSSSRIENLHLPTNAPILDFTLQEFNKIFSVLQTWSFVAGSIYISLANQGYEQEICMPTQLIPIKEFVYTLSLYSELSPTTVQRVVDLMSYTPSSRSDIYLQPLYVSENQCLWSPFLISKTKSQRNLLKLLAKTPSYSNEIATLVGSRENAILNDLGLFFAKRGGFSYKLNTKIANRGECGEVDLLLYTGRAKEEVLLIEVKCVIPVDDVNEVASATNEMIKAQSQLNKCIKILTLMSGSDKKQLYPFVDWDQVRSFYGLVLTPESYPGRNYVHDEIPATTIQILKYRLKTKDIKNPSSICEAFKTKYWLSEPKSTSLIFDEVLIGDVTYKIPGVEL